MKAFFSHKKKPDELNDKVDSIIEKLFAHNLEASAAGSSVHISRSSSCHVRPAPRATAEATEISTHADGRAKQDETKKQQASLVGKKYEGRSKTTPKQKIPTVLLETEMARTAKVDAKRIEQEKFRRKFNRGRVNLSDLKTLYSVRRIVGEGAFGYVRIARHRLTGNKVAIKSFVATATDSSPKALVSYKYQDSTTNCLIDPVNEANILSRLKHPNIIQFYHSIASSDKLHIVLEFASDGSLFDYLRLKYRTGMPESIAKDILLQVLFGLNYIHRQNIAHRDIKTENILMDEGAAKISDFGLAKCISAGTLYKSESGTTSYLSPQAIAGEKHDLCLGDMWSLGVVLYKMLSGKHPFRRKTEEDTYAAIRSKNLTFPDHLSKGCKSFLQQLLERDERKRLSSDEALVHPWTGLCTVPTPKVKALCPKTLKQTAQLFELESKTLENFLMENKCDYPQLVIIFLKN